MHLNFPPQRCDIEWSDSKTIRPAHCKSVFRKTGADILAINGDLALQKLQNGHDAAIVSFILEEIGEIAQIFRENSGNVECGLCRIY